ncbi:hypothetical protein [Amycolatopsis sp. Hca4]|uniref:hypothetical protein n=1 Tax=Amycolatopsis sp. Hca4 TaxID=2742131 RepID=UPI001591CE1B|nr:hypothetical protein [Amycolatopsis sp. Hca4]QKV73910.1 hypothetical protein HUT10_09110 [Amycolatopsis sp. Hca4]
MNPLVRIAAKDLPRRLGELFVHIGQFPDGHPDEPRVSRKDKAAVTDGQSGLLPARSGTSECSLVAFPGVVVQVRKKIAVRVGEIDQAIAVLTRQGVHPRRARATLCEMARERHISLGQCAALVASSLDRTRD